MNDDINHPRFKGHWLLWNLSAFCPLGYLQIDDAHVVSKQSENFKTFPMYHGVLLILWWYIDIGVHFMTFKVLVLFNIFIKLPILDILPFHRRLKNTVIQAIYWVLFFLVDATLKTVSCTSFSLHIAALSIARSTSTLSWGTGDIKMLLQIVQIVQIVQ